MNKERDIEILRARYLDGPNIWTYRPVIEAWVDIGQFEDLPSNALPGLYERITTWLPGLVEHRCGIGEPGGFLKRLREGTWAGHIIEHLAIELQNMSGLQAGFGKARETGVRGIYKVAFRARNERVGRRALTLARELFLAAADDRNFDVAKAVAELREILDRHHLGPSTASIIDAASARRVPVIRLSEGNLVQLGYGANLRRVWTAETDRTSAIAEGISRDKTLTKNLLESVGVPVPRGEIAGSPENAWEIAEDIGLPVVVKPVDGNHARGVSLNLSIRSEIEAAWQLADSEGSEVLVERFIPGSEHRLLVVGGEMVAAIRGELVSVRGDGSSSVSQLIDMQLNSDPRRGAEEEFPLDEIRLENNPVVLMELQRQGLDGNSVPDSGREVLIQRTGNMAVDVTDEVHPDVAAAVILAARVIGLDIAGVDLVAQDISRPLTSQGGAIVEVNAGPGLLMHLKPAIGAPRPVGEKIVEHLLPAPSDGRIPVIGISGTRGGRDVAHLLAYLLGLDDRLVGLACADGTYLGKRTVARGNHDRHSSGRQMLMNPRVEAAVIENGPTSILNDGLAYDRCHIGIVTDLHDPEQFSAFHVSDTAQLFNVLRTQVDVVLPDGFAVLNADNPDIAGMASLSDGDVILFGETIGSTVIAAHLAEGGRAVVADAGTLQILDAANPPIEIALGMSGPASLWQAAAVAAAWGSGVTLPLIKAGIEGLPKHAIASKSVRARRRQDLQK
ncbi:cyanophycin synthetase [Cognatazoarcus halotolerans]|uniref:cyanophycin synthetase n=1 Tax=Cognatazoarcus halotolerans TaxID=2686016 RepID=UPI00135B5418|nr:cyanophycin synthetase [Cognatazoarcus halotolerans]MCB1897948.1 cyanophycin synthetase [Rhodocyclaceae bacterium]MCP5309647.1 cyanophycin synthetase [Zoogloeaceae bacterium]